MKAARGSTGSTTCGEERRSAAAHQGCAFLVYCSQLLAAAPSPPFGTPWESESALSGRMAAAVSSSGRGLAVSGQLSTQGGASASFRQLRTPAPGRNRGGSSMTCRAGENTVCSQTVAPCAAASP